MSCVIRDFGNANCCFDVFISGGKVSYEPEQKMGKLQLTCSVKEAWIFLNLPFFLSLLLCRADESLLRFSGPRRVNHGYKILTDETPVTFVTCRSLVACVSTCLDYDIPCFSVNFQSESGICELLVSGSGNQMERNPNWGSVTLTEQVSLEYHLTMSWVCL